MSDFQKIVGMRVVAVKGEPESTGFSKPIVKPKYILFDDKETVLMLDEQDYYDYHDCDKSARTLFVAKAPELWKRVMESDEYQDANYDIY